MKTAVLLMAYGAAATTKDIPAYLQDIRGGRPASQELVAEVRERYRLMGGRSPLLEITRQQAAALKGRLEARGYNFDVFIGMRHSPPTIREAVEKMKATGVVQVVALPLTPFYSKMSVGAYQEKFRSALADTGAHFETLFVESWNEEPSLIELWANRVREAIDPVPQSQRSGATVLFSAHSLPERILKENDPYPRELRETASAVAKRAGIPTWQFAYQSKGRTPEPWLGPDVSEIIDQLAINGSKTLVLIPIGFISDHMETLFDDDIMYRRRAEEHGMRFFRARSLNADPLLAEAMANVVLAEIKNKEGRSK